MAEQDLLTQIFTPLTAEELKALEQKIEFGFVGGAFLPAAAAKIPALLAAADTFAKAHPLIASAAGTTGALAASQLIRAPAARVLGDLTEGAVPTEEVAPQRAVNLYAAGYLNEADLVKALDASNLTAGYKDAYRQLALDKRASSIAKTSGADPETIGRQADKLSDDLLSLEEKEVGSRISDFDQDVRAVKREYLDILTDEGVAFADLELSRVERQLRVAQAKLDKLLAKSGSPGKTAGAGATGTLAIPAAIRTASLKFLDGKIDLQTFLDTLRLTITDPVDQAKVIEIVDRLRSERFEQALSPPEERPAEETEVL